MIAFTLLSVAETSAYSPCGFTKECDLDNFREAGHEQTPPGGIPMGIVSA